MRIQIQTAALGTVDGYEYVLVFVRSGGRWVYHTCSNRHLHETFGGFIQAEEALREAAYDLVYGEVEGHRCPTPAFDFLVRGATTTRSGQVFFAELEDLDVLAAHYQDRVELFDTIPGDVAYFDVVSKLFRELQNWLNLQSAPDEIWDIYDAERKLTGRTHRRGDPLAPEDFHLVVHVWIKNSEGLFLISQRAPNKGYPLMWECTGGSAMAGDDSLGAAIREVKEELGLEINPSRGTCLLTLQRENDFLDVWLFEQDFDISKVKLQVSETIDARWASEAEIRTMMEDGEYISCSYLEDLFEQMDREYQAKRRWVPCSTATQKTTGTRNIGDIGR